MKKQKQILLSISLLASNRKETTRKCLESLKPLRENLSSELIIVDTGCDEEMQQLISEYATKVVKFEWCHDFAKARNVGLKQAKGEWFLFIDDDEWFENVDDIIKFFKSGNYKKYAYANYIQRNYLDAKGMTYTDTWASRMVRLDKEIHFESKIHEYMTPIRGKCAAVNSYVHHYGYVYKDREDKMNHFRRNESLLLEMKEEEPDNMRWWVQLAQEYRSVSWDKELLDLAQEALKRFADRDEFQDNMNIGTFHVSVISALAGLKRREEALEAGIAALHDKRNTQLCYACVYLYLGEICLRLGKYKDSEMYMQEYFRLYDFLSKEQGILFIQKSALLVNETFDSLKLKKAYSIIICSGLKLKKTVYLKKYLKDLEWDQEYVFLLEDLLAIFTEAMSQMPEEEILVETVNVIAKHPALWEQLKIELRTWELSNKSGFDNIVQVLAAADEQNGYLRGMRIRKAVMDKDYEQLNEKYKELFGKMTNVFELSDQLWKIAREQDVPLEDYYLDVPFLDWKNHLRDYIANTTESGLKKIKERMHVIRTKSSRRYEYFDMRICEAEILIRKKWDSFEQCRAQLQEFAERTVAFNGLYYKEEIVRQYPELLPKSYQAAFLLQQALSEGTGQIARQNSGQDINGEMEQGLGDGRNMETEEGASAGKSDWETTKECLKQCAATYHGMTHAIKEYIRLYGVKQLEIEQKAREAKEELHQLTIQLKEKIRELLKKGMAAEAGTVVDQLRVLLPQDLEVITLSLQVKLQLLKV